MSLSIPSFHFSRNSRTGPVRQCNEDATSVYPDLGLLMLADGIGGNAAGDVASKTALQTIHGYLQNALPDIFAMSKDDDYQAFIKLAMIEAVLRANKAMILMGEENPRLHGMGCTLVLCLFVEQQLFFTHAGDSRLYRYTSNQLEQLTLDHSLYQEHIDMHGEADRSIKKNIITRALGRGKSCTPDIMVRQICDGEAFFCSTDGLHDYVSNSEFMRILLQETSLSLQSEQLLDLAYSNGSTDNASVVLVRPSL